MTIQVFLASLSDCRAIAQIHVDAWRAAYAGILSADYLDSLSVDERDSMWRTVVERGSPRLLIAKTKEQLAGWVAFGESRDKGAAADCGEIWAINVTPSAWSKGVGRTLLQAARAQLAQTGYRAVSLWVIRDNTRAILFYRTAGFTREEGSEKYCEIGGSRVTQTRFNARLREEPKAS